MKKIYSKIEKTLLKPRDATCEKLMSSANVVTNMMCEAMVNHMGADEEGDCPCSGEGGAGGESKLVDLFILVDSSGSVSGAWEAIGESYKKALEKAKEECGKDVNAIALYVDNRNAASSVGALGSTIFTQSHEAYLQSVKPSLVNSDFRTEQSDAPEAHALSSEEGAEAMIDIIKHNNWREGACRAILYVSDEWLDSLNGTPADRETRAKGRAKELIIEANAAGVTLFAHHLGSGGAGNSTVTASNDLYKAITSETKGALVSGGAPTPELYTELLVKAVCQSCANASACATVEYPKIEPCVHVSWGASDCDCIESHDDEVICISLCNCYTNVTFEDVSLAYAVVVDEKGNMPPLLPDGSPSVHLYPTGPVCFGDIGPCVDGEETCVSRQFVLLTRGAVAGKYKIKLGGICFGISKGYQTSNEVEFEICKD